MVGITTEGVRGFMSSTPLIQIFLMNTETAQLDLTCDLIFNFQLKIF